MVSNAERIARFILLGIPGDAVRIRTNAPDYICGIHDNGRYCYGWGWSNPNEHADKLVRFDCEHAQVNSLGDPYTIPLSSLEYVDE